MLYKETRNFRQEKKLQQLFENAYFDMIYSVFFENAYFRKTRCKSETRCGYAVFTNTFYGSFDKINDDAGNIERVVVMQNDFTV